MGKSNTSDKHVSRYEDRVNKLIIACSPFGHFRGCGFFFLGYPPFNEMERESHGFLFFSFHKKGIKILETDAA